MHRIPLAPSALAWCGAVPRNWGSIQAILFCQETASSGVRLRFVALPLVLSATDGAAAEVAAAAFLAEIAAHDHATATATTSGTWPACPSVLSVTCTA
jgi:hypothetical protein